MTLRKPEETTDSRPEKSDEFTDWETLILPVELPLRFRYRVVDVSTLQPSHLVNFDAGDGIVTPNDAFDSKSQGRIYSIASMAHDAVVDAVKTARAEFLLDRTCTAAFGPPLCVLRGDQNNWQVVAGHQRAIIMRYQSAQPNGGIFSSRYLELARRWYPELSTSWPDHPVVIRELDLPPEVPTSTLLAINRLTDAPLTKPRDTLATVKALLEVANDRKDVESMLLGWLSKANAKRSQSTVTNQQTSFFLSIASGAPVMPARADSTDSHFHLSSLIRRVADDFRQLSEKEIDFLFSAEQEWTQGADRTPLKFPFLTSYDVLPLVRKGADGKVELTETGARDLAFATFGLILGGVEPLEHLQIARQVISAHDPATRLPGSALLSAMTRFTETRLVARTASVPRERLASLFGRTLSFSLASLPAISQQKNQYLLFGSSPDPKFNWCDAALADKEAGACYAWFLADRQRWVDELDQWCENESYTWPEHSVSPAQLSQQALSRLCDLTALLELAARNVARDADLTQTLASTAKPGRGRRSHSKFDQYFSLLTLNLLVRLRHRFTDDSKVMAICCSTAGIDLYRQLLDTQNLGDKLGQDALRRRLRERGPAMAALPSLISAQSLRAFLAAYADAAEPKIAGYIFSIRNAGKQKVPSPPA